MRSSGFFWGDVFWIFLAVVVVGLVIWEITSIFTSWRRWVKEAQKEEGPLPSPHMDEDETALLPPSGQTICPDDFVCGMGGYDPRGRPVPNPDALRLLPRANPEDRLPPGKSEEEWSTADLPRQK